ncbi:UvrB/UvrC motif-containing protein [Thermohalobacter berrensis]|uniref:UVR domain-containing protein n=1 Tax=Thermohalobacter berrensis TaxID=99594 RepID=A0A419T8N4_9FIRM|nr:UvrB/UvrC motif-containing protein [Thermohalobacter berrensis]RKD33758.1 hypothetical protein BET03_08515 [Thermohalobacter berrensis]
MLCDECGKNKSTVHYTKILNGKKEEIHLCDECAKDYKQFDIDSSFSIHNFLTGLLDNMQEGPFKNVNYVHELKCNRCGLTYNQFRETGKFGCSECYKSFHDKLIPLLKRIHRHDSHIGKVPKRAGSKIRIKKEITKLKNKLEIAVKKEEYEKAAELRDKIKELKNQIDSD